MILFNRTNEIWADHIDNTMKKHNKHKNDETGYTPNQIWKNDVYIKDLEPEPEKMRLKETALQ